MSPFLAQHANNAPNVNTLGDNAPAHLVVPSIFLEEVAWWNRSKAVCWYIFGRVARAHASMAEFIRRVVGRSLDLATKLVSDGEVIFSLFH